MGKSKKSNISFLLLFLSFFLFLEISLFSEQITPLTDFKYELNSDSGITIRRYKGFSSHVIIPKTIEGKVVTTIGEKAFFGCKSILSISIPPSVSRIEAGAFTRCFNLEEISIPKSVKHFF